VTEQRRRLGALVAYAGAEAAIIGIAASGVDELGVQVGWSAIIRLMLVVGVCFEKRLAWLAVTAWSALALVTFTSLFWDRFDRLSYVAVAILLTSQFALLFLPSVRVDRLSA
jgi:hypothetical protein